MSSHAVAFCFGFVVASCVWVGVAIRLCRQPDLTSDNFEGI